MQMDKQVELNQGLLTVSGTQIDVGGYRRIMIGRYEGWDIEKRKRARIYEQLEQEGLLVHHPLPEFRKDAYRLEPTEEGKRREEELHSTVQHDSYLKYLILLYSGSDRKVDYRELRQRVHDAIPNELKDSINVKVHIAEPGGRLIAFPPPDGIEMMVADDVELNLRL